MMDTHNTLREVAALRHNLHINNRLRLEFLASISKLLRDYGISADDEMLGSLILAVPDELSARAPEPPLAPEPPVEPGVPGTPEPPFAPEPPVAPGLPEAPEPPLAPEPPVAPES